MGASCSTHNLSTFINCDPLLLWCFSIAGKNHTHKNRIQSFPFVDEHNTTHNNEQKRGLRASPSSSSSSLLLLLCVCNLISITISLSTLKVLYMIQGVMCGGQILTKPIRTVSSERKREGIYYITSDCTTYRFLQRFILLAPLRLYILSLPAKKKPLNLGNSQLNFCVCKYNPNVWLTQT